MQRFGGVVWQDCYLNLTQKLYIDDYTGFSNTTKSAFSILSRMSNLLFYNLLSFKLSKTFLVIINDYYINESDEKLISEEKLKIYNQKIEVKDYKKI